MASFQAKKGWKWTRKSENKNCISLPFQPDGKYKTPKKEKKIKKYHCRSFQAKIRWIRSTKERK